MTQPDPVPLLTAEGAQRAARSVYRAEDEDALLAIATERAKVCKVMTEAELRKEFDVFYTAKIDAGGHMLYEDGLCGYLALARRLGLVADNTETGS